MARHLTLLALLLGLSLSAFAQAQSKLPPCPKPDYSKNSDSERFANWTNCWGRYKIELDASYKGDVLEGEWLNGWLHGRGTTTYANGDKYVGEYKDGKRYSFGTYTFADGSKYVGEYKDGTINGQGTFIHANGDKYVGEFKDNNMHGQGTYYFLADNQSKGNKYVGQYKDGKKHGQGTFTFASGNKYLGEWKDGKYNGLGKFTYADGRVLEGIWADDEFVRAEKVNLPSVNQQTDVAVSEDRRKLDSDRQTQSKLPSCPKVDFSKNTHLERFAKWHNCYGRYVSELNDANKGDVYEGEFQKGRFHGQGQYTFAEGDKYVGMWKKGVEHGLGTYYFLADNQNKGDRYVGEYKNGKWNGQGSYTYANGNKYVGEYKDNKRNGLGTYYFLADDHNKGDKYVGEYKDGKEHGLGTYYFLADNQDKGDKYVGEFKDGKRNGQGTYYFLADNQNKGDKFVGEFKDGKRHGQGTYTSANGVNYVGEFKDGKRHGQGTYTFANGLGFTGEWKDDKPNGIGIEINEERNRREQAKQSSKLSLQTTTTNSDANGVVIISVRTNADTSSLKVNGEEQGGRSDGNYNIKKVARVGQDTKFTIIATDINGNTDSTTITVARQAVLPPSNQSASLKPENIKRAATRDAVAIIIGIQNYKRVPKADFANSDAKEFYEYAIRGLGIKPENIKLLVDEEADEIEIVRAFENWLPLQVTKNKTDVYVFYSGHGLPSPDGQSLYFLPYGVDKQYLARTAVGQKEVVALLTASKPKSVTMFIDACYSGQTRSGEMIIESVRPLTPKSDLNAYPSNFTVISASSNDQYSSSSPELKHGIFSFYLMKGMEGDADGNKDGKITAGEMQEYLSDKVSRQAMSMSRKQDTQLVGDANKVLMGAR